MRFCQPHWTTLRAAIDERGLSPLVARGGAQAARNFAAEARDGPSIKNFDPLMVAHNQIWSRAMEMVGLELMRPNEDGSERCPLCFVNEVHAKTCKGSPCRLPLVNGFDSWIPSVADWVKGEVERLVADAKPDA